MESFKRVYAPFAGVITKRNVDLGTPLNAGNGGTSTREMFDLAQTDPLRVYVAVPQTYAHAVQEGMKACLELSELPDKSFCGKVVRSAGAVDPATRTLLTEVDVPNPSNCLLEGEYAQVHFDAKLPGEHLSVPNNALLFRPDGTMAAVVEANNRIDLKKVIIGRDLGTSVEVLSGITSRDAFVINPPDALEQDQQVKISPNADSRGS
jgi:membrane fusion protein, multidrug efflux system